MRNCTPLETYSRTMPRPGAGILLVSEVPLYGRSAISLIPGAHLGAWTPTDKLPQGSLAHAKHPPPYDPTMTLSVGLR